jgi:hypothetical protein
MSTLVRVTLRTFNILNRLTNIHETWYGHDDIRSYTNY